MLQVINFGHIFDYLWKLFPRIQIARSKALNIFKVLDTQHSIAFLQDWNSFTPTSKKSVCHTQWGPSLKPMNRSIKEKKFFFHWVKMVFLLIYIS